MDSIPEEVGSKEAEAFKVCKEIHDSTNDLLMRQTECAIRDYRDRNRKIYLEECLQERLLPLLKQQKILTIFWSDLDSCHFTNVVFEWYEANGHFRTQRYEPPLPNAPEPGAHKIIMGYCEASTTEASPVGQI